MLDIRKARLMLQSGHKPRDLDLIFIVFMKCVKFNFYFCFYVFLTQHEYAKKKSDEKMGTYLFLVSNSFPEMIDGNSNLIIISLLAASISVCWDSTIEIIPFFSSLSKVSSVYFDIIEIFISYRRLVIKVAKTTP